MYYNTNGESGQELSTSHKKANKQELAVLSVFESNVGEIYTPEEILRETGLNCPLTSIRRAISDLTKKGLLEKTEHRKMGIYGKMVHTWRLADPQTRLWA